MEKSRKLKAPDNSSSKVKNKVKYVSDHWQLYAMLVLPLIVLLIFAYGPMGGIIIAFKKFQAGPGIFGSPWAENFGMENFIRFFSNYNFKECLWNTLVISFYSMVVSMPCAVILALSLNYAKNVVFRKVVQMISYFPYFISTVVFVGILNLLFDTRIGVLGQWIYNTFDVNVIGSPQLFSSLYVWTGIWQGVGFGAIIYIAALSGVDMQQHEAAIIDGATLLQRIRNVDLPAILPTCIIMLVLNMGSILNVSYEKILAMQNQNNARVSEVITTYAYKVSLVSTFPDFSYATAIGLFQSLVGLFLILATNKIANRLTGTGFM